MADGINIIAFLEAYFNHSKYIEYYSKSVKFSFIKMEDEDDDGQPTCEKGHYCNSVIDFLNKCNAAKFITSVYSNYDYNPYDNDSHDIYFTAEFGEELIKEYIEFDKINYI